MVDADQGRRGFGKPLDQPFRDAASGPIFARRWRRSDFNRRRVGRGHVDAQTLQARARRLRPRIVDADIAREGCQRSPPMISRPIEVTASWRGSPDKCAQRSVVRALALPRSLVIRKSSCRRQPRSWRMSAAGREHEGRGAWPRRMHFEKRVSVQPHDPHRVPPGTRTHAALRGCSADGTRPPCPWLARRAS